jgi:thiol-disulfide isomerase/thioredoxin
MVLLFCSFTVIAQKNNSKGSSLSTYSSDGVVVESYDFALFENYLNLTENKIYVINFWATWCLPCVKELPFFEAIHANYKGKNVEVILVSLDMPQKIQNGLIPFIKKKKLQSRIIHLNDPDANAWIEKVNKDWSGAIPATVIYTTNKRKFYEQSFTYEELEKEVQSFIQ